MAEPPPDDAGLIQSPRLDLVLMTDAFMRNILHGDAEAAAREGGFQIAPEAAVSRQTIRLRLAQLREDPKFRPWSLRSLVNRATRTMIGYAGFHTAPDPRYLKELAPGGVEFGYQVFPSFRRLGYAREAAQAMMAWAYQRYGVLRFVLTIAPDNLPSQGLARSLGFVKIGAHIDPEDGPEDILLLELTKNPADWSGHKI